MDTVLLQNLLGITLAALIGGLLAKALKLQPILGYLVAGVFFGVIFPSRGGIYDVAQVGAVLLLFSTGIELSFEKLIRVMKPALIGAAFQIIASILVLEFFLVGFGFDNLTSLIFALGLSLSSTVVVVKILSDRGESDTIHGELMTGWLIAQDLAVIPMLVILPVLAGHTGGNVIIDIVLAFLKTIIVLGGTFVLGNFLGPRFIHFITSFNSRELLVLGAIVLALGTAAISSVFGITPAIGAFLAGVVISRSQESHAIFAETRPLRDLFVAMFFVTLGFLVSPTILIANFWQIIAIVLIVLVIKIVVAFFVSIFLGYHGKTAIATSFGLSQVGEFAFVLFSQGQILKILSPENVSVGFAVVLLTLLTTPLLFKAVVPFWRWLRDFSVNSPTLNKFLQGWDKKLNSQEVLENHIIICGYGRVGKWVGRALVETGIPFVVVEYNQAIVNDLRKIGVSVIYGDPTQPEVIQAAGIGTAKVLILAIPDREATESLIAHVQTVAPDVKIITRAHFDEDFDKLRALRVDKVVQPEFEAAIEIIRTIFKSMGRTKEEIAERIKSLRLSKAAG